MGRAGRGVVLPIEHAEARPGDLRPKVVSSQKAFADLGWKPQIEFEEGAERYVKWVQENMVSERPRRADALRTDDAPMFGGQIGTRAR